MERPGVEQSKNVEYVGFNDLKGNHPFKLAIRKIRDRWYLYAGCFDGGWAIVDITDPRKPEMLNFLKGPDNTLCIQVTAAEDKLITGLQFLPFEFATLLWGCDPGRPYEEGILIWDIETDPANPRQLGKFKTGGFGTHRNVYTGGKYVHLVANMKGYVGNIPVTLDISDPANPVEVGRWHYPGQWVENGETPHGTFGLMNGVHGPIEIVDNTAYLPYQNNGIVILDYSDLTKPEMLSNLSIGDFGSLVGVHSVMPIPKRNLAIVTTEAFLKTPNVNGSYSEPTKDAAHIVGLVDISEPRSPRFVSLFPTPVPEEGAGYTNFAHLDSPFGPHNVHHYQNKPEHAPVDNIVHQCYFNAGLRIIDISDPTLPREVGHFVAEDPPYKGTKVKLASNFDDVIVDSRGYAFVTDRNQGLFVLRYTG